MMRRRRKPRPRAHRAAYVAACTSCAADVIPGAPEYQPGHHMAPVHVEHAGELEARGWTIEHDLYCDKGTTDVICPHIQPVD